MSPEVLLEALGLKDLDRAGWVRVGVHRAESVAAHSWGVAWLVLALLPPELDQGRALAYAVLHDLAEVRTGDITPEDGVDKATKDRAEQDAIAALLAERPDLQQTWTSYEAQADAEARFVKQLDRLDMALQAVRYHREGRGSDLQQFLDSAARDIYDPALVELLTTIRAAVR